MVEVDALIQKTREGVAAFWGSFEGAEQNSGKSLGNFGDIVPNHEML